MPAISPASFEDWNRNEYYKTDEDHLVELADAMHTEYTAIIEAGLVLQIDDAADTSLHPPPNESARHAASGRRCASSCLTTRCAASRPT